MKFATVTEVQSFLIEIDKMDECAKVTSHLYEPTDEELNSFIKSRKPLASSLKNSKKSSAQKYNWLKNRSKIMRGIARFHRSADGKRFHRKLGRFLATRVTESEEDSFYDKNDYLIALNSLKQHLLIELSYYKPILESVETEIMIFDYALPIIKKIEESIISGSKLTDEESVFLMDMVSKKYFIDSLSEMTGQSFSTLHEIYEKIENKVNENLSNDSDSRINLLYDLKKELYANK